jgi:tripartite-type tricarboxylate transporter receptor subunit TctC
MLALALASSFLALNSLDTHAAQAYPNRTIKLIVPFTPGGSTDFVARLIGEKLTERTGQSIVIENKPGAGGSIGSAEVARAPADGYTLLLGTSSTHGINPWIYKLPYDVAKDFAPVAMLAVTEYALTINPSKTNVGTIPDLLNLARTKTVTYASMGNGTTSHLSSAFFAKETKTPFVHVPYKTQAQAQADLLGGQVDFMIDNISNVLPQVKAGKLRILATTGAKRSAAAQGAPTIAESGVPGYEMVGWFVLLAPAGTPDSIVARLNTEAGTAMQFPDVKDWMLGLDIHPHHLSATETAVYMDSQREKFRTVVTASGAKAN